MRTKNNKPDVFQDRAAIPKRREDGCKSFEEGDRASKQTKQMFSIDEKLQAVVKVSGTKYEHVAKLPVTR